MALTPSTMVPLGTPLPDLTLPTPQGEPVALRSLVGEQGLLVLFLSNHCPYVRHVMGVLGPLARELAAQGVATVGIHSNNTDTHPQDGAEAVVRTAQAEDYGFVQLMDPAQQAAVTMRAACTPDVFLHDASGRLVYRGQLDGTRPGSGTPTGEDVRRAVAAMVADRPPLAEQVASTGCNIKWKPGNAPQGSGWLSGP